MADHLHDDIPLGLTFDDVLLTPRHSLNYQDTNGNSYRGQ